MTIPTYKIPSHKRHKPLQILEGQETGNVSECHMSAEAAPGGIWGYLELTIRRGPSVRSRRIALGGVLLPTISAQADPKSDHDPKSRKRARTHGDDQSTNVDYDYRGHLIGCGAECDTIIRGQDISKHHCVLFPIRKDGRIIVILQDLATSGTRVNGTYDFSRRRQLIAGDIITICSGVELVFCPIIEQTCCFNAKYSPVPAFGRGSVYLYRSRSTGRKFSAQFQATSAHKRSKEKLNLIPLRLRHPNIPFIHEVFDEDGLIISIWECTSGSKLSEYLSAKGKLTEMVIREISRQLFAAVGFLVWLIIISLKCLPVLKSIAFTRHCPPTHQIGKHHRVRLINHEAERCPQP
ncbi:hypothetical protein EDB81DRAFT_49863 [Dactylonectria macrodidyma]|uniref:FHA domain-containing protein n=1 Tax=Dactylonectria macrodidyma TaxID=307937 RepID=A0A9P9JJB7_9HYPO|nr:hypothetical protein EDB81DRAFT_49863 [Dactylonectria macrodidyma]